MKVFCLLITETHKGEIFNPRIPIVSNDVRKAQSALKKFADTIKKEFKEELENGDWTLEADEDGWFEAYQSSNYSENNVLALIFDRNLDELTWED